MSKLKLLIINFIAIVFGTFITYVHGGIWKVKNKINCIENGFIKQLLINIYERKLNRNGSWIGYNSYFKNTPIFPHGMLSIFISGDSHIGKNCVIFQQTTIGSNTLLDSSRSGSPCIGDNCYIGAGAKIIGSVKIGNNCRIGANCVVVKDVPDNCVVVLEQPRVIQKDNLDNRYYFKGVDGLCYYENGAIKIAEVNS